MSNMLRRGDYDLLLTLADCRVLTCEQLAVLCGRNVAATRQRLRDLKAGYLIKAIARTFDEGPGRPDGLVSLSRAAVDILKEEGLISESTAPEQVTAERLPCVEHQLVVNETRIQLVAMQRAMPEFQVRVFNPVPLHTADGVVASSSTQRGVFEPRGPGGKDVFVPDGVFVLSHKPAQKTLLFFLEVDMNTQPLNSRSPCKRDVRRKIGSYQECFRQRGFARYEDLCGCPLRGFRLLLLTTHAARLSALCRIVRAMPPSNFIWLTDRPSLLAQGIWAAIWVAGGMDAQPRQSILGTKAPDPCPSPTTVLRTRDSTGGGVAGWLSWMFRGKRECTGQSELQKD